MQNVYNNVIISFENCNDRQNSNFLTGAICALDNKALNIILIKFEALIRFRIIIGR